MNEAVRVNMESGCDGLFSFAFAPQPQDCGSGEPQPWQQQHVEVLPTDRVLQHTGTQRGGQTDEENRQIVGCLSPTLFGGAVSTRQQIGAADIKEVPAHAEQDQGGGERVYAGWPSRSRPIA